MHNRIFRKIGITVFAAGVSLPISGCLTVDARSAIADLTSSTIEGLAEILATDYVDTHFPVQSDPDLEAPISEQVK